MSPPRKIVLARSLTGAPIAADFRIVDMDMPAIHDGELLVKVMCLSLDPYIGSVLRGRHMSGPPPELGGLIPGMAVAQIVETRADGFAVGDFIVGETGWCNYASIDAATARKVDPTITPLSLHLGVCGLPGLSAYASVHHLANISEGDTVLVSSAAGPVGGTVGQISRIHGAQKVVGIAGSAEKCRMVVQQYGFDACINYKADNWEQEVAKEFPDGISFYHDNVGGHLLDCALANLANYGRVVLCGLASQYQLANGVRPPGPNPGAYIVKRAKVMGLVVYDYFQESTAFANQASQWIADGQLRYIEDSASGLETAPALFEKLMSGANIGKTVVNVALPEHRAIDKLPQNDQ